MRRFGISGCRMSSWKNSSSTLGPFLGKKLTTHSFRHTFATRMAEQIGNNPFILKKLMGHSKITTTEIYCQPQAPDLVMRMPDLSKGKTK